MGNGWIRPLALSLRTGWAGFALLLMLAWPAAAVTCETTSGFGSARTTVRLDILNPSGATTVVPTNPCSQDLLLSGTWAITGQQADYDVHLVIDASGSTTDDSGIDVNGNGLLGEIEDNIYQAEILAARTFVAAADPAHVRVASIRFNKTGDVWGHLSNNLPTVDTIIDSMRWDDPRWDTYYVRAMEAVDNEVVFYGNRLARQQVCIFLSDGIPDDPMSEIQSKSQRLADLGVVIHTFALGFTESQALEEMAAITGGTFTALSRPGDIVGLLPGVIPLGPGAFTVVNERTGVPGFASLDLTAGTFRARVTLVPGTNRIVFNLGTDSTPPIVVECGVDVLMPATLVADAGPPADTCTGARILLDGSASLTTTCSYPLFQWFDCWGAALCPASSDPTCEIIACAAGCDEYRLELICDGEPCTSTATVTLDCTVAPPLSPRLRSRCGLSATLECGGDPGLPTWWDLDTTTDSDGDGDPTNDGDMLGCNITATFPTEGLQRTLVWTRDSTISCTIGHELHFTVRAFPAPRNLDGGVCPGERADFSCGSALMGATYWWDFKGAIDSNFDGDPTNDVDEAGCDASVTWVAPGTQDVHCWERDSFGCLRLVAVGTMIIGAGAIPGEVPDLMVGRRGPELDFAWGGVPGAATYRVARGTLANLWILRAYDHSADDLAGQGTCDTGGLREFVDPDDADGPANFYYLVTATLSCGGEGLPGQAWDRTDYIPRPPRIPSPGCP